MASGTGMRRAAAGALVVWLSAGAAAAQTPSAEKIALVIGNSNYRSFGALPNPARDAKVVADSLRSAGFRVTTAIDRPSAELGAVIESYRKQVAGLASGGTSLIYYSGHGFAYGGENVLVLVDAKREKSLSLKTGFITVSALMRLNSFNSAGRSIIVIDACRNLADLEQQGVKVTGFTKAAQIPDNTAVVYSTSALRPASDGEKGRLSPFTDAFVDQLERPSQPWPLFIANVASGVKHVTQPSQSPEIQGDLALLAPLNDRPATPGLKLLYAASQEISPARKLEIYTRAAQELDDVDAMVELGLLYWSGHLGSVDDKTALTWFEKAAGKGSGEGYHRMGEILQGRKDIPRAIAAYEEGRKLGNAESTYHLAGIYSGNPPEYKNIGKAITYYKENLEFNNCCSAVNLGHIYLAGVDVEKNVPEAVRLFQMAADRGNAKGWTSLANVAFEAGDYPTAIAHYRRGMSFDEPLSTYGLAEAHLAGKGVDQNNLEAERLFALSGSQGFAGGWARAGLIAAARSDGRQALEHYGRGEQAEDIYSTYMLGVSTFSGLPGVAPNPILGLSYIEKAAAMSKTANAPAEWQKFYKDVLDSIYAGEWYKTHVAQKGAS